jgi:5-methylcytosine-specific restriction endonuclease McrA
MQATDEVNQRRLRESILRGLLETIFAKKDAQRGFSEAQRRIMWNTAADRRCQNSKCRKRLAWDDFTIDHIDPYAKGGRTRLENAALMCRSCNSAKGKRKRR